MRLAFLLAGLLDAHLDALLEGSLMVELEGAALVSGGGGCAWRNTPMAGLRKPKGSMEYE